MTVTPVRPADGHPTPRGAAAGAAAAINRAAGTQWGLVWVVVTILVIFAIPSDSVIRVIGAMGFPGGLAAMTLFGIWVGLTVTRIHAPTAHRNPTTSLLMVFTVSTLVAYLVTQLGHPAAETTRGADRGLMLNAACAGLILVVAQGCNSRRAIRRVTDALLVGTTLSCLVALVDGISGVGVGDLLKEALPGFTRNSEYGAVGSREGLNRVAGTALHPIEFGAVVSMVLAMGIARVVTSRGRRRRLVRIALTAVVALGIPLSLSRSALLGGVIVLLTLLICSDGRRRVGLVLTAGVGAGAAWLGIPQVVNAFVGIIAGWSQDNSIAARVFDYAPFLRGFAEHPWFGQGLSTVQSDTIWDILDNQYLGWLLERGLVGTVGPLALMVAPLVLAIALYRRLPDGELRTYAASLAAAFAVAMLLSGTFDSFGFPMFVLVHSVLVGVLGAVWVNAHLDADRRADRHADRHADPHADRARLGEKEHGGRMMLLNIMRMLRRDWWVILLVVLMTAAAVVGVKSRMADTYEATSEFGLQFPVRPPSAQDVALNPELASLRVDNPMLNYDSRGTVTEIVVARVTSGQSAAALAARGVTDYRVDLQPTRVMGGGTLLFTTVAVGHTPEQALRGASEVRAQVQFVLRQLQGPAATSPYRITLLDVNTPVTATRAVVDQVRVLAAIALLGLLVLLAALSVRAAFRTARPAERSRKERLEQESGPPVASQTPISSESAAGSGYASGPGLDSAYGLASDGRLRDGRQPRAPAGEGSHGVNRVRKAAT